MIAWASGLLKGRRHIIRLRNPASMRLHTGSDRESIDATFDEGGRILQLVVHTRSRILTRTPRERTA